LYELGPGRYHWQANVRKKSVPCSRYFVTFPVLSQVAVGGQEQAAQHARQAQQYLAQQRPDLAIPEFKAVVDLDPKNLDAQANLGVPHEPIWKRRLPPWPSQSLKYK
jgi:hypothetical protein